MNKGSRSCDQSRQCGPYCEADAPTSTIREARAASPKRHGRVARTSTASGAGPTHVTKRTPESMASLKGIRFAIESEEGEEAGTPRDDAGEEIAEGDGECQS